MVHIFHSGKETEEVFETRWTRPEEKKTVKLVIVRMTHKQQGTKYNSDVHTVPQTLTVDYNRTNEALRNLLKHLLFHWHFINP